jgi:hypothetical protein
VCLNAGLFGLGVPLVLEMARTAEASQSTLVMMSPTNLASTSLTGRAYWLATCGFDMIQRRLLVVRREPWSPVPVS